MKKSLVNVSCLKASLGIEFIKTIGGSKYLCEDMTDVMFDGKRIAIINGLSSSLQWTAVNGSDIPNDVIDYIELQVIENLIKETV